MKKVELQDILKYKYPEKLEFNPSGSAYAYHIATAEKKRCLERRLQEKRLAGEGW